MLPDKNVRCPATGFAKSCREIVSEWDCPKFVSIQGANPNTGEQVNKVGCIDSFIHMLLIENSQQQRQTGAAVESFRNEVAATRDLDLQSLVRAAIAGSPPPPMPLVGHRDEEA